MRGVRRLAGIVGIQLPLVLPQNPASRPSAGGYSPTCGSEAGITS